MHPIAETMPDSCTNISTHVLPGGNGSNSCRLITATTKKTVISLCPPSRDEPAPAAAHKNMNKDILLITLNFVFVIHEICLPNLLMKSDGIHNMLHLNIRVEAWVSDTQISFHADGLGL